MVMVICTHTPAASFALVSFIRVFQRASTALCNSERVSLSCAMVVGQEYGLDQSLSG